MPSIRWVNTISGSLAFAGRRVHRSAIDRVTAWRVAAIRPIHHPVGEIEIQVDRFRQAVKKHFDVFAVCRSLTRGDFQIGAEDAPLTGVIVTFLRPVNLAGFDVEGDAYAPFLRVRAGAGVALARVNEGFELEPSRLHRMTRMPSRSHQ